MNLLKLSTFLFISSLGYSCIAAPNAAIKLAVFDNPRADQRGEESKEQTEAFMFFSCKKYQSNCLLNVEIKSSYLPKPHGAQFGSFVPYNKAES